jgi:hypothetical protein
MAEVLYNQKLVFISAKNTINALGAERAKALRDWDAKNVLVRVFLILFRGIDRRGIKHEDDRQIEVCERLIFKVENSLHDSAQKEWGIALTDHEIDQIREHWSEVLDPPAPPPDRIIKKGMA